MHLNFLGADLRLWTVPLIYNALPSNDLREGFQIVLGIGCWSALAVNVARSIQNRAVATAGFTLVLCLGLVPEVTTWDGEMLSESIAVSLLALLAALLLRPHADRRWIAAFLFVVTLWAFARGDDMLVFLVLLPVVVAIAATRLPRRVALGAIAAMLTIGAWGGYSTFIAQGDKPIREFNASQLIVDRWAYHPDAIRYLGDRGLPVRLVQEAVRQPGNEAVWLADHRVFRTWADRSFLSAYAGLLLRTMPTPITAPLMLLPAAASAPLYNLQYTRAVLPLGWLWGMAGRSWVVLTVALMVAGVLTGMRKPWVPLGLLTVAALFALQTYDLATRDYLRLFMPADVALHIALLVGGAWTADHLVALAGLSPDPTGRDRGVVRASLK